MQQALQNAQAQQAQNPQLQNVQLNVTPTIKVTPGSGNSVILGQSTNETKVEMDITMQATGTGPDAPPPGKPNSATMTTNMDTFVAPGVAGYQEFGQFYRRMAQEVSWMKLPANIHVADPRVSQSMAQLQQNSDALKGFPLRSYVATWAWRRWAKRAADRRPRHKTKPRRLRRSRTPTRRTPRSAAFQPRPLRR